MVENKLLKVSCLDKLFVSKSLDWPYNLEKILMNHMWFPIQSHNSLSQGAAPRVKTGRPQLPCPKVRQIVH